MKPTIWRRYFCTKNVNAGSSPVLTRSMISASEAASGPSAMASAVEGSPPAIVSRLPPIATLLTSVETPFGPESCAPAGADRRTEMPLNESVTLAVPGVSEDGMAGSQGKGYLHRLPEVKTLRRFRRRNERDGRLSTRTLPVEVESLTGSAVSASGG